MTTPNEETRGAQIASGSNILLAEGVGSSVVRIGHTVDAVLEDLLWKLVNDELQLTDFSPAFQLMWCIAADQGRASANRDEIDQLTRDRDRWYACWANGWTPGEYLRRQTAAMWETTVAA